ncbi:MAG: hypothetical protein Q8927_21440 [Bacteroidota bacterium]|nr:hypothetical protein [Bacteroidota bacterium]MDP4247459.1 hypothetical protein [Bacteroidota bacterium]MDP4260492.1 hypothetical protein [Bacteroidota bacterium]
MSTDPFQIEFTYQNAPFIGLVTPFERAGECRYSIDLESENQESHLRIQGKLSNHVADVWDFTCGDGEPATNYYDKDLLQEIGEAIEKHLVAGSDAATQN